VDNEPDKPERNFFNDIFFRKEMSDSNKKTNPADVEINKKNNSRLSENIMQSAIIPKKIDRIFR
jgi:hypothetical protein